MAWNMRYSMLMSKYYRSSFFIVLFSFYILYAFRIIIESK